MSRGKNKMSFGRILLLPTFILLGIMVVLVGTVSYAKYISREESKQSANVANMGVELFELVERGKVVNELKIDYTKVVPGADIPGPHIRLQIESEVTWSLFVKVKWTNTFPIMRTLPDGHQEEIVYFNMADGWEVYGTPVLNDKTTEVIFRYDYVFRPSVRHDYVAGKDGEIEILLGDAIFVSQYYDRKTAPDFTLSFEAYIRQVLE